MSSSNNFGQRTEVPYHGSLAGDAMNRGTGGASFGQQDPREASTFGTGERSAGLADTSSYGGTGRNEPGVIGSGAGTGTGATGHSGYTGAGDNRSAAQKAKDAYHGAKQGANESYGASENASTKQLRNEPGVIGSGAGSGATGHSGYTGAGDNRTATQKTKDAYHGAKQGANEGVRGERGQGGDLSSTTGTGANTGYEQQTLARGSDGAGLGQHGERTAPYGAGYDQSRAQGTGLGHEGAVSGDNRTATQKTKDAYHGAKDGAKDEQHGEHQHQGQHEHGEHGEHGEHHKSSHPQQHQQQQPQGNESKVPRNPEQEAYGVPDTRTTGEKIKDQFHVLTGGKPPARQPHGEAGQKFMEKEAEKKGWNKGATATGGGLTENTQDESSIATPDKIDVKGPPQGRLGEGAGIGQSNPSDNHSSSHHHHQQQQQEQHTTLPQVDQSRSTRSNITSNKGPELAGY